jgi:HAD superfamily hydrolase (TIGR01509 family)
VTCPAPAGRLRALILDFDGLILDTESPIFESWREAYRRHGQELEVEHWQHGQELLPGIRGILEQGRSLGLGTGVASSSSRGWVEGWLERHGIRPLIDVVCARGDVACVKPAPDLFLLAAERLGVAPLDCLVFEDSPNGIRAARAAGMRCVAVPNAVTRLVALPEPDLLLRSAGDLPLHEIASRVGLELS